MVGHWLIAFHFYVCFVNTYSWKEAVFRHLRLLSTTSLWDWYARYITRTLMIAVFLTCGNSVCNIIDFVLFVRLCMSFRSRRTYFNQWSFKVAVVVYLLNEWINEWIYILHEFQLLFLICIYWNILRSSSSIVN